MSTKHIYGVQCSVSTCRRPSIWIKWSVHQLPLTWSPNFSLPKFTISNRCIFYVQLAVQGTFNILKPFTINTTVNQGTNQVRFSSQQKIELLL